jgi:hypothetical protein
MAEVGLQLTTEATDITRTDVIDIRQLCLTGIRSGSLPPFVPPTFFSMIGLMIENLNLLKERRSYHKGAKP